MKELTVEQVKQLVGKSLGASEWLVIDQEMINSFADLTGDRQFIHVDVERARETPFGGTIAHGFLTLSLVASMIPEGSFTLKGMSHGVNYGFDSIRFLQPVRSGSRIRSVQELSGFEQKGSGTYRITIKVTIEIEGEEKPALSASWITMQVVGGS